MVTDQRQITAGDRPRATPPSPAPTGRPLRVLDITDFYSETKSGGVKTYLRAKSRAFARMGVQHAMVVPSGRTVLEKEGHTRVYRIRGPVVPVSKAYRVILSPGALREALEAERPDVIEVGSPFIVPHLVHAALRSRAVPTVGFYHADVVRTFAEPYVQHHSLAPLRVALRMTARRLVQAVYSRFDATVAASRSVAQELRDLGVPRVRHVGLGVNLDLFRPDPEGGPADRTAWGVAPGKKVGIFVGRFAPEKRLDVVLDGHARLPEEERPHLVLVGGGPLEGKIRSETADRPDVTVLPYMERREDVARAYAASDFYIAAGPGETFGLSIGEALAAGVPVLCVARGAGPDRIEGADVGELYEHGRPASAAEGLVRISRRVNPEMRRRARMHAEATLSWRTTFESLVDLYQRVQSRVPS
jgi:alpha-1,6-mannosyltransferase